MDSSLVSKDEYPVAADLRLKLAENPLPNVAIRDLGPFTEAEATSIAGEVLEALNTSIANEDLYALGDHFLPEQAYWKDSLALTYHLRTFTKRHEIAASLLETARLRGAGGFHLQSANFVAASSSLQFIDCNLSLKTTFPAATCSGRMLLLPVQGSETPEWKIWILSTRLEGLDVHPEDESLLRKPSRFVDETEGFETDVFIIGGGNGAVTLAARLKALGVESVMVERNANPGDNWALRYDSLKFHVPTAMCDMPYLPYANNLKGSHLLTRDELASQVRHYVEEFHLNMITSAQIISTHYHQSGKRWIVRFQTPAGLRTATSKHLVQATGFDSQQPYLPQIEERKVYKGLSLHSVFYKNPQTTLKAEGVKSVIIIGSANTAFDILEDCHAAGLHTTIVARSPTYVIPIEHILDSRGFGLYDELGAEVCDKLFMTLPTWVDCHLAHQSLATFAAHEPDRYKNVIEAGFRVIDSAHPDACLMHNLLEKGGGHYCDIGGTNVIAEGKVNVVSGVEPVAYMGTGLRLSDGTTVDADAIIWCTGYADKNGRDTALKVLGGGILTDNYENSNLLGPRDIADRLDATFGVDSEGEIRGFWKRQLGMDNFWFMGGHTQHHRYHSKTVTLQIKAELEGFLPPAYRDRA